MVERLWLDAQWAADWDACGIDLTVHQRSDQLSHDLAEMGVDQAPAPAPSLALVSFGAVLGSLYVVEGSALGGQMLAPHMRAVAGDVPTAFFESTGRNHPRPWRALKAALTDYGQRTSDHADVIAGARDTFEAFGASVGATSTSGLR